MDIYCTHFYAWRMVHYLFINTARQFSRNPQSEREMPTLEDYKETTNITKILRAKRLIFEGVSYIGNKKVRRYKMLAITLSTELRSRLIHFRYMPSDGRWFSSKITARSKPP